MNDVDLLETEVERDLRAAVRAAVQARCAHGDVLGTYDGGPGPEGLWSTLARDLGVAGLLVPEEHGGSEAGVRVAAVVQEELGRHVAPVPYLTSAVVATTVLVEAAAADPLADLAAGDLVACLVVPWTTAPHGSLPSIAVGSDGLLAGTVRSVAGAVGADLLLVPVVTADGVEVHLVAASDAVVSPVPSLDMSRPVADVRLDGARAGVVVPAAVGEGAVRRGLLVGAALLAAEQVGVSRWCLETTVDYLRGRRQFGRVLGSYQALKHRLADLFVEVEQASAAAGYAAAVLTAGGARGEAEVAVAVGVAQAWCSDVAVHAAEEALQLHGGIGMTWEHPVHLYLKRAKADQLALGTPGSHRERLAVLVDLPPAALVTTP